MTKRMISLLLVMCMVVTLLPALSSAAHAASTQFDSILRMDQVTPSGYDPNSTENPYGYKLNEPFLLNPISELLLYKTYDLDSDSKKHMSTTSYDDAIINNAFNSGNTENLGGTKDYLYVEAVAFDPTGSGRKDHVAYIGLDYDDFDPDYSTISVWVQDTVTGDVKHEWSSSSVASWFVKNTDMYQHEAGNFFAITAGDYSGNGKETIVAYIATDNLTYGLVELRYNAETEALSLLGNVSQQDMLHQKYVTEAYFGQEMAKTEKRQNKLSCDLATGDFNGDGIDDLAVLSYINRVEGHSANADWDELDCAYYCPWLRVAYGQENGHEGVLDNDKTEFTKLWKKFLTYEDGTKFYLSMIAPGLATGDTDGDGKDEIIVAGYENTIQSKKDSDNSNDCDTPFNIKKNKIIIASFDAENRLGEIGADNDITRFNEVDANGWLSGTSTSLFTNDPVWQPMGVECVAFNGHANKELAFIGGTIYDVDGEPSEKYTPNYFTQNDAGVGSVTINTGFIPSVAVGNFDGNTYGYEQIIFLVGLKENLYHDYFYLRGFIGREYDKDTGELKVEGNKDVYYSNGDSSSGSNHISNTLIIDNKGDNFSQVLNCVLVPIDRDHDGAMVRYVGVDYAYSDPQVMAVLQAAPWFGELGDDYGATTYTFTQEYEYTVGKSDSVSFGAGGVLSLEGTIGGIDIKAGYVMDWTESFEDTLIRSTSDSFTAKAYDSVVVYRTPVYIYKYETFNPEINDWHGDGMSISVPKMPTYIQMSVSDYNAFADAYNQLGQEKAGGKPFKAMKKLDLDWLGKEGNPWGYSNSLTTVSNAAYRLGYNGGETSSTSADGTAQTETISQAHGFTFEMTATFGFDACFVSSKAGFYGSLDYMNEKSESTTTSSTTETSGTVQDLDDMALLRDGIPESVTRAYGFTWELGKTTRDLGVAGENALILGYRVTDITAPAPPVIDLEADLSGETAVELTWNEPDTAGRLPVNGYNVYQKDGKNYARLNDELLGADRLSFDISGLKSNTEYTFVVTTFNNEKGESLWSNEAVVITPKKNVPLYLEYDRNDVRVTASHLGNVGIASGQSVPEESIVYIEVVPKDGYTVTRVSLTSGGDTEQITSADGKFNFIIRDQTTIKVEAASIAVTSFVSYTDIIIDEEENQIGSLTGTVDGYAFDPSGAEVYDAIEFTATPEEGYVLKEWHIRTEGTIALITAAGSKTLTFYPYSESQHVTAVFAREDDPNMQRKVLIKTADGGAITVTNDSGIILTPDEEGYISVYDSTNLTFEIAANKYYTFQKWTDAFGAYGKDARTITWKALENITVGAEFFANLRYPVTFSAIVETDGSGTLSATANESAITSGTALVPETKVVFDAQAGSDSRLLKWAISEGTITEFKPMDGLVKNDTYTIVSLAATSNVDAYFKAIEQYALTITEPENGSISVKRGGAELKNGDEVVFGDVLTITTTPADGYILSALTANGSQFTSGGTLTVQGDVTIAASFSEKPSGGSGESGGGGGGTPTAPAYKADVKTGDNTETPIPVTVDEDAGNASADIGAGQLTPGGTVITMPSIPNVDTYTVGIPVPDLSTADTQGSLTVETSHGIITVPSNMLTGVEDADGDKAQISIGEGDKSLLPESVKAAIGDRPLIQLTLSIDGKQTGWSNPNAPVTVSIPYTPTAAELLHPESIIVWYIDGSGNVVTIPNGRYDAATGMVTFSTTHFSDYAVVYNKVSFNDVASTAWYGKAVSFIAAREITTGTGGGNYSPEAKLTRGEFIVLMMRAYGISPDANPTDNFTDAGNIWYTGYLAAAKRLGISAGVGNNQFAPEKEITRQEMFTLLYNALKVIGQLPEGDSGKTLTDFTDADDIASWGEEAMTLLVKTGTVSGSGGKLMPTDTTTRAEMAQVLYNLLIK